VTHDKPIKKVERALVDANNIFEEPDVDVIIFQVTQDNQIEKVGGATVGGNNMEAEDDKDITPFQVSDRVCS
jgi:pantothenate kinase